METKNQVPKVYIRVPRQLAVDMASKTIAGKPIHCMGMPDKGMNYYQLCVNRSKSIDGKVTLIPTLIRRNTHEVDYSPSSLIISFRNFDTIESTLKLLGYSIEDLQRASA